MADNKTEDRASSRLEALNSAISDGMFNRARQLLETLHPAEVARLLEAVPRTQRYLIWQLISDDQGDILSHVNDEVRSGLIDEMEDDELLAAATEMDMDDLADVYDDLPEDVTRQLLTIMGVQDRHRLLAVLSYPEDSAGGLMNTDTITVRSDVTLEVVLRYLRIKKELPAMTDSLSVVGRHDDLIGTLPLTSILTSDPDSKVSDIMDSSSQAVLATTPAVEVAAQFELHDLISAPVVDESNKLLGRITIDDVVDVIRDEADQDLMRMAGLDEDEDVFAPVIPSATRRAVWLGINLCTALLASWVIGLFEATLDQIVALAILMPIVASMGGIAGSQTLTLVIRSMALGQLGRSNTRWLLIKEVSVGALNGVLWAIAIGIVAFLWFDDLDIALIIAAALIINLVVATFSGVTLPLLLKKRGVDPALAGSVLLTTITDVVGFMAFLGLATWWML